MVAVALVASGSYGRAGEFHLRPGQSARVAGHSVTYLGMTSRSASDREVSTARVRIDGGGVYAPALTKFSFSPQAIGTPSVHSRLLDDVYLRLVAPPADPGGPAVIGVIVQPLILWLWLGGAVIALGTALAGWPGRRSARPSGQAGAVQDELADETDKRSLVGGRSR
jgi:cytochrome c-type biogenesis protein CcmF